VISDSDSNHDDASSDINKAWLKDKKKTDFQHIGKLNIIIKELYVHMLFHYLIIDI